MFPYYELLLRKSFHSNEENFFGIFVDPVRGFGVLSGLGKAGTEIELLKIDRLGTDLLILRDFSILTVVKLKIGFLGSWSGSKIWISGVKMVKALPVGFLEFIFIKLSKRNRRL